MEIASTGRIAFQNLDRIGKVKSDDEPDPLLDPAIEVKDEAPSGGRLAAPSAPPGISSASRRWGAASSRVSGSGR